MVSIAVPPILTFVSLRTSWGSQKAPALALE
jgi:hypothetical protein